MELQENFNFTNVYFLDSKRLPIITKIIFTKITVKLMNCKNIKYADNKNGFWKFEENMLLF